MNINKLIRTVRKAKANTEEVLTLQLLTEIEVVEAPVKPEIAGTNKTVEQIELELLENIIERFSGVYPEYYRSIIDDMIEDIKNPSM